MIVRNAGNRMHTLHALLILVIDGTIYKVCLHASNTLKFYRLVMGTKMNTGICCIRYRQNLCSAPNFRCLCHFGRKGVVMKRAQCKKQVKPSSFTEDQPPGWNEKASKSRLGKHQSLL